MVPSTRTSRSGRVGGCSISAVLEWTLILLLRPASEHALSKSMTKRRAAWHPLDLDADYTYASYYYMADPGLINVLPARDIQVLREPDGRPLDGTEVVARYLQSRPGGVAPERERIRVLRPLPSAGFGSPFIQPLRGAGAAPASEEGRSISGTSTPDTGGTTATGTQN